MISHVSIGIRGLGRAIAFYVPLMAELGLVLKFSDENCAGWKHPDVDRPLFVISYPYDGRAAEPGNGQMVALLSPSRATVKSCYTKALENGGTREGEPGLRPHYHPDYYGACFRDPDGNKLCICCHHGPGHRGVQGQKAINGTAGRPS